MIFASQPCSNDTHSQGEGNKAITAQAKTQAFVADDDDVELPRRATHQAT